MSLSRFSSRLKICPGAKSRGNECEIAENHYERILCNKNTSHHRWYLCVCVRSILFDFVVLCLWWLFYDGFSFPLSHQSHQKLSIYFWIFAPQLLPFHFSSSLSQPLLFFGVHCCRVHCTVYLLCQQFALIICESMHGNHFEIAHSIMQTTNSTHARTRSHSMNVKSMKRRIQFILFFSVLAWEHFPLIFSTTLKQPHQPEKSACSHFLCGFTNSVQFFSSSHHSSLSLFWIFLTPHWYSVFLARRLKTSFWSVSTSYRFGFMCHSGIADNFKVNQTLNLLIWHVPRKKKLWRRINAFFGWNSSFFRIRYEFPIVLAALRDGFRFLNLFSSAHHLINDFVYLVFLNIRDWNAFIFVEQFRPRQGLIYGKKSELKTLWFLYDAQVFWTAIHEQKS